MQFYQHGHVQIGTAANGAHEKLMLQDIVAEKAGFVYVYISSESAATHWVYFDDMKVTLNESPVIQDDDYYPFGLSFNSYQRSTAKENKYLYNGKEKQDALGINWLDYGARMYMPEIGRWGVVDPLAEQTASWSPYVYVHNNPINMIDPDGRSSEWIPDSEGNLIAEKGDNAQTLADFQGISYSEAAKQLKDQGYIDNNGNSTLKVGDKVELDNLFTRSIENSTSDLTLDKAINGTSKTGATSEDNYNCWGAACAGSQGKEIKVGVGIPDPDTFDNNLKKDYTPTTENKSQFGKTVLRFADSDNQTQHGAVYYGKSQDGTTYVYTKNGWYLKPEVMKLSDLQNKIPSYGTVKGISPDQSGYYNPK
ncbi:hypothetical protein C900_00204 [Fulvivirga imtechensis AK7]|uniref:RHS repeat-associated core domain-containing protein n=2 Tax=Fulvivirga TaxID=396811 RepID=L8JIC7_9BACT|nr:hypothetical protein C900_00204 [Fulvivirga imtechensis AK7]